MEWDNAVDTRVLSLGCQPVFIGTALVSPQYLTGILSRSPEVAKDDRFR